MSAIIAPVPLYEGLLRLATPEERATILAGGPRKRLDHAWAFPDDDDEWTRVRAAFAAIQSVLLRMHDDLSVCITGLDARVSPPKREIIETEIVRAGRLMWDGVDGERSILQLDDFGPTVRILDLRVEPVYRPASPPPLALTSSNGLLPGERKQDTDRLRMMQEHISAGHPPKTAARMTAAALPDPPTSEDSLVTRLVRKFGQRKTS